MIVVAVDVEYEARYTPEDGRIHYFATSDVAGRIDGYAIPRCQQGKPDPALRVAVASLSGDLPVRRGSYRTCRSCMRCNREDRRL